MKLLILTQKVDATDDVLGFMHGWIAEFAKNFEAVTVVCLEKGEYNLAQNVNVLSLGKENGRSRLKYFLNFYKYIWQERKNYDVVFVHMNPEYVVFGGLLWRLWGKKVGLWYAHGAVTWPLQVARIFVHTIFTSTVSGCRIKSKKIKVVGQGIDTEKFRIKKAELKNKDEPFEITTVGRISPSKDYETLIKATDLLHKKGLPIKVSIVGGVGLNSQDLYLSKLTDLVSKSGLTSVITFVGPVSNEKILPYLHGADLFVNMGQTGSLDKAILEAMAVGLPILTCNEALIEVLGDYRDALMYPKRDYGMFADRIERIVISTILIREKIGGDLRDIVIRDHSLPRFVKIIANELNGQ